MARFTVGVLSWSAASDVLGSKESRKIGHNTYLESRIEGEYEFFAIRYHGTDVVTILPDNTYRLNTGGYRTVTTKQRINALSPANVYQDNFQWEVRNGGGYGTPVPFYDGITVDRYGREV